MFVCIKQSFKQQLSSWSSLDLVHWVPLFSMENVKETEFSRVQWRWMDAYQMGKQTKQQQRHQLPQYLPSSEAAADAVAKEGRGERGKRIIRSFSTL